MNPHPFHHGKVFIAGLLALAFASPAWAGLHKCVDEKNRTYYQDKPCQEMMATRLPNSLATMGAKEENRAFFWMATGGKGTFYLLGSLHFGAKSPINLPQMVTKAFNEADVLVVEADIETVSGKEMARVTRGKGIYADNGKLEDHIKPVTWKKTVEIANKVGFDEEALHPLKPWLATFTLTNQSFKQQGYTAEFGIDNLLIQRAQGKKPVMELESIEAEIDLIDQFSDQEQEQMLLQTLKRLSQGADYHKDIINAWEEGDAEAMDLSVRQSFDPGPLGSKLYKTFLLDRNERMANRLVDLANDGRTYFVVVGADHLGGEKGILKLLAQKGYSITQP
ncbi:MAG: TraB/GumN family protein [Candidatus Methylumidiphilus sp.]